MMKLSEKVKAVIFDMDGTLVHQPLDFSALRKTLNIAPGTGILEAIGKMHGERRDTAYRELFNRELAAAGRAELKPAADIIVQTFRDAGYKTALLTRNSRKAVTIILKRFPQLAFDVTVSREDCPFKPDPASIRFTCDALNVSPAETACVGDYIFDIQAAKSAGAVSILIERASSAGTDIPADYHIDSIRELLPLFDLALPACSIKHSSGRLS